MAGPGCRNAQRHHAEYDRVVTLVFPWPAAQNPQQPDVASNFAMLAEKPFMNSRQAGEAAPAEGPAPRGMTAVGSAHDLIQIRTARRAVVFSEQG
jgi:hypothetical protein